MERSELIPLRFIRCDRSSHHVGVVVSAEKLVAGERFTSEIPVRVVEELVEASIVYFGIDEKRREDRACALRQRCHDIDLVRASLTLEVHVLENGVSQLVGGDAGQQGRGQFAKPRVGPGLSHGREDVSRVCGPAVNTVKLSY